MKRNQNRKELPTAAIANELRASSVYFSRSEVPDPAQPAQESSSRPDSLPGPSGKTRARSKPAASLPQTEVGTNEGTMEQSNERFNQRTNGRSTERKKMRHTFDIFQDQLSSLRRIKLEREETFGKRYLMGELVQEALDMFITKERKNE